MESGESLPGFETGRGLSITEKVRIKGLIERTRVVVVETMRGADVVDEEEEVDFDEDEREYGHIDIERSMNEEDAEGARWEMEIARVYDRTVVELGDVLGDGGT